MDEQMNEIPKRKIKYDVVGAPYKIGATVKILDGCDETFDARFKGKVGQVVHFNYSCHCGQTYPGDPMIGVKFRNGVVEEFWREELSVTEL